MKFLFFLFTMLFLLIPQCVLGDIIFPASLTRIDDDAFSKNEQIFSLKFPEGLATIGSGAFSGCSNLKEVSVPDSLIQIGSSAFSGCAEALYFRCSANSMVKAWIVANGFDYSANTVCRALLIGQTYSGTSRVLQGSANDLRAVRFCLQNLGTTDYTVTASSNLTSDGILSAVSSTFSGATEDDISLLYYSGHGDTDGSMVGSDMVNVTPSQLKVVMDAIPGRKVIIVDACYAGNLIEESTLLTASASDNNVISNEPASSFNQALISTFSMRARGAPFAQTNYYVMTSCRSVEESEEGYISDGSSGRSMGFFTYYLSRGCGWDGALMRSCTLYADINADGIMTFQEAFSYAYSGALTHNPGQHALVFPANCTTFSPFRP